MTGTENSHALPTSNPTPEITIDARGELCPVPVIRTARAAKEMGRGVILLIADDPATRSDIPAWCQMKSATLLSADSRGVDGESVFEYRIVVNDD